MNKQANQSLTLFLKLLFISVLTVLIISNFALFSYMYEDFVLMILSKYGKLEKIEKFKEHILTPERFLFAKYLLFVITIIYGFLLYLLRNKVQDLSNLIIELSGDSKIIFKGIVKEIYSLTLFQKVFFLFFIAAVIIFRLYFILKFPLNIDEVFSYLFFVDKGFIVSATYYPGPNNHIFYSELCVFTDAFLNSHEMVMRLPSLVAGICASFLFFILLKKYFNFNTAIFAAVIFSFSFNICYYSIHGRGYILLILFVLISAFSVLKIIEKRKAKRIYDVIFILSSILGFYTIPVFLYPYLSLIVFAFIVILSRKDRNNLKRFIVTNIIVGCFVFILYLPVLLFNGIDAVTGNKWVEPLSLNLFWASFTGYLVEVGNYIWNIDHYGSLVCIVVALSAIFILVKKGYKKFPALMICIFIVPLFVIMIQRVQPFNRVWDFTILFFSIALAVVIESIISIINNEKIKNALVCLFFAAVLFFSFKEFNEYARTDSAYYNQVNIFTDKLIREKPGSVYVVEDTYNIFLRYKSLNTGIPIDITVVNDREKYDFIILPNESSFPFEIKRNNYMSYYSNSQIHSYKLIK